MQPNRSNDGANHLQVAQPVILPSVPSPDAPKPSMEGMVTSNPDNSIALSATLPPPSALPVHPNNLINGPLSTPNMVPLTGDIAGWSVKVDPCIHYTGWARWRSDAFIREPPMMNGAENAAHAQAVAAFRECYAALCDLDDQWHQMLSKKQYKPRFSKFDHEEGGKILDQIEELGPQLQPLITQVVPTETASILGWHSWHMSRLADAEQKMKDAQIAVDLAERDKHLAGVYLGGLVTAIEWCETNAPTRGVKLPKPAKPTPPKLNYTPGTVNVNTPGIAIPTDASTRPVR